MTFDEIAGHPNGVKEIRHSSKPGLPSRRKHPPKPDLDPINSKWLPRKYANSGPRNGSAFLGAPLSVFNRRPRKWVQIAAPEMGPWTHLKIQKIVPRINKLGPKRAPKVASGEGSSSIQRQKWLTTCLGQKWIHCVWEDKLIKKTYVNSKINSGGHSYHSEMHTFLWPHFWDREFAFLGAAT